MYERISLIKQIWIETNTAEVYRRIATLGGLRTWLIDDGSGGMAQGERFWLQYGNVTNNGVIHRCKPACELVWKSEYSIAIAGDGTAVFPMTTCFSVRSDGPFTVLTVLLNSLLQNGASTVAEVFDLTYSKVLLNLKAAIELNLDLRPAIWRKADV